MPDKDVPEEDWFCSSCLCAHCGSSDYNPCVDQFTEKSFILCDQCERKYHVGCLKNRGREVTGCPNNNWFCSTNCSKIFHQLRELLGKSNSTSVEGLHWTVLRWSREGSDDLHEFDTETRAENYSKLLIAVNIFHECFEELIEARTQSDLVTDVVFNKEIELNRLNFWGFYTMLLEKDDEIISVLTFRVFGEKLAEMPLIGTRFHYRRQGMCRLLMDEVEKLLSELGVEKILLPAAPHLLSTWTNSFGFSEMKSEELLEMSQYTTLNFYGTTMCQKVLRTFPRT